MRKSIITLAALCAALAAPHASANSFITLGTQGGPLPRPDRSQPANALVRDNGAIILVDAGDGAAEQLAKAKLSLAKVDTIFLSHMHFDHTAGVLGVLALRFQQKLPTVVTIYGPPGTAMFVDGLVRSMVPFEMSGFGVPGEKMADPHAGVRVIEITDGSTVTIDNVKVTAAQNTHYTFPIGSKMDADYKSLAFRFEMPDRSIVFTGDTGPSKNVEKLAKGADILVTEVIDVDKTIEMMRTTRPDLGDKQMRELVEHQETQHLPYAAVGQLAHAAGVGAVVLTHIVPGPVSPADEIRNRRLISKSYTGPVVFARDLDSF